MKTRTAVLYSPGESIRVEEIMLDPPKEHEVQVKIVAAGVCHSDYHLVSGELPGYMPMALGHEGAGIVEEVGSAVTSVKPGDHVVLSFIPSCGTCYYCTRGHTNLCNMGASILMGTCQWSRLPTITLSIKQYSLAVACRRALARSSIVRRSNREAP